MGEITVNLPDPEPPTTEAPHHSDNSLALAVGELKGELASQKTQLDRILHNQSESAAALQELTARTEVLLQSESEPEESEEPEPVAIPPPLLVESHPAPTGPTTPESEHHEAPKRRLGMFHGW